MTNCPHLASNAAVGFAATVSSRVRPCFFQPRDVVADRDKHVAKRLQFALLLTGLP
jgi:hypothetical protein